MKRSSTFWGLMLILAGGLFLLNSLGILRVDVWGLLWPLFLIGLGIAFLYSTFFGKPVETQHAVVPLETARRARLRLQHGAGRMNLAAGYSMSALLEGDFGGGVEVNTRQEGDLLDARLNTPVMNFPFNWTPGQTLDWNLQVNPEVPLSLDVETGASQSYLDLSGLQVADLYVKAGAASTEIVLPVRAGFTQVKTSTGAGSLRIQVPEGVAARIRATSGLARIDVNPARFPNIGGLYQSPDFDTAPNRVDISIETGVGAVDIV